MSTAVLRQIGLENHFFRTITYYIFLERYCYVDFRCKVIFEIFGHLEPIFGRRSSFFGQNGLENQFFITMTNYIFLGRVPHPNLRLRAILEIFCDLGS